MELNDWIDFWYNQIGANIIPADTRNKKTWIKWGESGYQTNPIEPSQIEAWKKAGDFNNGIAIMSGKLWRGDHAGMYLIFIDCDNELAIKELCTLSNGEQIPLSKMAEKWIVEQHRGAPNKAHIYVISPMPFPKKSSDSPDSVKYKQILNGQLPAIEIKGEGKHGIAYCSPSLHRDGTPYDIIGTFCPQPLTDEQARALLEKINNICNKYGLEYLDENNKAITTKLEDYLDPSYKIPDGQRHNVLITVAAKMAYRYHDAIRTGLMTEQKFEAEVWEYALSHCVNPPDKNSSSERKKMKDIVNDALKFILKKREDEPIQDNEQEEYNPFDDKESSETQRTEYAVEKIKAKLTIVTMEDTKEMFYYKDGIYEPNADAKIHEILGRLAGPSLRIGFKNQVIDYIRSESYVSRDLFDNDINWIHVENGWLNIHTREFAEHDPDRLSIAKLPIKYDKKARCPRILKFLHEILRPEDIKEIIKFIGYLLLKEYKYHKFFVFVGEGGNGKGTLIRLMERFVGERNLATVSPHDFVNNRFAKARLFRKLLNACGDVSSKPIEDTDVLKGLTGQDLINAEMKNKDPFDFRNYAKVLFSANEIPKTADESYGFWRRVIVIPFNKTFEGANMDGDLDSKLQTEEELSGLLNLALWGLETLLEENGFNTMTVSEMKKMYELSGNKATSFLAELCVLGADFKVETSRITSAFEKYCKEKGSSMVDLRQLSKEIETMPVEKKQLGPRNKRVYYYLGLALKEDIGQAQLTESEG